MTGTFNLRQQAYDRIRDWLRTGRLSPGIRISTLNLSKQLGISRTPVREALSRLASDGLVRDVPGFGVYIHLPDEKELNELYGLREVLEVYAARAAAEKITPVELEQLDELCHQWIAIARQLKASGEEQLDTRLRDLWIRIDEKFHAIILGAADSSMLFKVVDDMRLISRTLDAGRAEGGPYVTLSVAARTYRDHVCLYKALRRRDADAAERWIRKQIVIGRERHLKLVRSHVARPRETGSVGRH